MNEDFTYIEKKSGIGEKKKPEMNEDFTHVEKKSEIGENSKFVETLLRERKYKNEKKNY